MCLLSDALVNILICTKDIVSWQVNPPKATSEHPVQRRHVNYDMTLSLHCKRRHVFFHNKNNL